MFFKKLKVNDTEKTLCKEVVLNRFRNEDSEDGILIIAWHEFDDLALIQSEFIKIAYNHIGSFIRDYSPVSAQDYIDSFNP